LHPAGARCFAEACSNFSSKENKMTSLRKLLTAAAAAATLAGGVAIATPASAFFWGPGWGGWGGWGYTAAAYPYGYAGYYYPYSTVRYACPVRRVCPTYRRVRYCY
jgi:hypothetical protein